MTVASTGAARVWGCHATASISEHGPAGGIRRSYANLLLFRGAYVGPVQLHGAGPPANGLHVPFIQHILAPHQISLVQLHILLNRNPHLLSEKERGISDIYLVSQPSQQLYQPLSRLPDNQQPKMCQCLTLQGSDLSRYPDIRSGSHKHMHIGPITAATSRLQ